MPTGIRDSGASPSPAKSESSAINRDEPFIPAAPKSFQDAGVSEALVEELVILLFAWTW